MTRESMGSGRRGPANFDFEAYMKAQQLRTAAAEFLKNEGVALIIHGSG